jgi:purine-nucleoside phosphorylase
MSSYRDRVLEAAAAVRRRTPARPEIGILTGTGLGRCVASLATEAVMPYRELPHFPVSTVPGHDGNLVAGTLRARACIVMQGRFHLYEGYSPLEVTFPVRVMQELGVGVLIVTNAAGGLNPRFRAGDIMVVGDHLNLTGANPLVGANERRWGVRFPDMSGAYDPDLGAAALRRSGAGESELHGGVYAGLLGPSLETPAEVRFLKTIGADAVGFSTVLEVIAAAHAGMRVLGLSTITNIADPDRPVPATVEEIIAVAREAAPVLDRVIAGVAASL